MEAKHFRIFFLQKLQETTQKLILLSLQQFIWVTTYYSLLPSSAMLEDAPRSAHSFSSRLLQYDQRVIYAFFGVEMQVL